MADVRTMDNWIDACTNTRITGGMPVRFTARELSDGKLQLTALHDAEFPAGQGFDAGITLAMTRVLPIDCVAPIDDHLFDLAILVILHEVREQYFVGRERPREPHQNKQDEPHVRSDAVHADILRCVPNLPVTPPEYQRLMDAWPKPWETP